MTGPIDDSTIDDILGSSSVDDVLQDSGGDAGRDSGGESGRDSGRDSSGSRVYFLSEVGYDTHYFNPDAYENLVKVMADDSELTGILIDGAMTRLDRPEFLCEALTYWHLEDEEECKQISKDIKNREQYKLMANVQANMVRERLKELRDRVTSDGKIVLSINTEDLQFTASAMLNEMLIRKEAAIGMDIGDLKTKKANAKAEMNSFSKEYNAIKKKKGMTNERKNLQKKIKTRGRQVQGFEDKIQDLYEEQKLYRAKKVRPSHQFYTKQFIEDLMSMYKDICDSLDVNLVIDHRVIDFDGMVVDYAHSRHKTGFPVKNREKALMKEVHGKAAKLKDIDIVLESGHFGIGYKQFVKLRDSEAETNFKNQSSYDSDPQEDHVTVVMALPFEDQERIGAFTKGKEPIRMSGGKPMSTRKIAATDRYYNGSVSGLTVMSKDADGIVSTEWTQFNNFKDGSILERPEAYSIIMASSDEHLRSPEADPMVTDGWVLRYLQRMFEGTTFRGRPAFAEGYINGGDVGEANSRKWQHRYHHKRSPEEVLQENIKLLSGFKPENIEDIVKLAMKMTNDSMGGSVESMQDMLEAVADYFDRFALATIGHSRLKWAHISVPGNHTDDVLKDLGLKETDFFLQRMKARGVGVYESGRPDYHVEDPKEGKRIFLGGYSNARVLNIEDYGRDVEGDPMFGPINLVIQHDPKGSGMIGTIGAGKNVDADLALSGHTHDNKLKLYRKDDNEFGVAYKLATLQGIPPTAKYYAGSETRTQGAHEIVMPAPGDFAEKVIPAQHLAELGRKGIHEDAENAWKEVKEEK